MDEAKEQGKKTKPVVGTGELATVSMVALCLLIYLFSWVVGADPARMEHVLGTSFRILASALFIRLAYLTGSLQIDRLPPPEAGRFCVYYAFVSNVVTRVGTLVFAAYVSASIVFIHSDAPLSANGLFISVIPVSVVVIIGVVMGWEKQRTEQSEREERDERYVQEALRAAKATDELAKES